jgi:hypothetical protein
VGIGWATCAAEVLLLAHGLDHDWIIEGTWWACVSTIAFGLIFPLFFCSCIAENGQMHAPSTPSAGSLIVDSIVLVSSRLFNAVPSYKRTSAASVEWLHVEDVYALHLSENFQSLKTSRLGDVGGDGTRLGTWWEKVGF